MDAPSCEPHAGVVVAVAQDGTHRFSKPTVARIRLLAGLGVEGDAHLGTTVQHRSRVRQDPTQPNLRQVHLIAAELLDELAGAGFALEPGQLGENVTTRGIDLIRLSEGTVLTLGDSACVIVTGLRNPCRQIEDFRPGLLARVLDRDAAGRIVRKAGIMGVVLDGGDIRPGDRIRVRPPAGPFRPLERV
jgi:MOSC domain-containing protein YiiM